jgi:hypothetical protein
VTFLSDEVVALEEPFLCFHCYLFAMAADFQFEVAVGHKVGENERFGVGGACGGHWRRVEGVGGRKGRWQVPGRESRKWRLVRKKGGFDDGSRHVL